MQVTFPHTVKQVLIAAFFDSSYLILPPPFYYLSKVVIVAGDPPHTVEQVRLLSHSPADAITGVRADPITNDSKGLISEKRYQCIIGERRAAITGTLRVYYT